MHSMQYIPVRFSRKLLWMKVAPTNHNPKVIARYYLECVEQCGGIQVVYNCCFELSKAFTNFLFHRLPHHPSQWLWNRKCQSRDNSNCFQDGWKWLLQRAKKFHVWSINFKYCKYIAVGVLMELWIHTHLLNSLPACSELKVGGPNFESSSQNGGLIFVRWSIV